jgi:23S rRNA pseudouridine955/2504/2580 synthase
MQYKPSFSGTKGMNNTKKINQLDELSAPRADAAVFITIDEGSEGQRVDNFLLKTLKGVPKSHVYRILRSGEVRVNKKRVGAEDRLIIGDLVRIPPIRMQAMEDKKALAPATAKLQAHIIFEDDALLVLNKPAGLAVHGGSGISLGAIEQLRMERPHAKFLELVHRLDRETSGVLLLAKKRMALVAMHEAIRQNQTDKRYLLLVHGKWQEAKKRVTMDLQKYTLPNGERRVNVVTDARKDVHDERQHSETIFRLQKHFSHPALGDFSLLEAQLVTGRTHQLRVQTAHLGFPIAGDDKYGDFAQNKLLAKNGLKRMFLHSAVTKIRHPVTGEPLQLKAETPLELTGFLTILGGERSDKM